MRMLRRSYSNHDGMDHHLLGGGGYKRGRDPLRTVKKDFCLEERKGGDGEHALLGLFSLLAGKRKIYIIRAREVHGKASGLPEKKVQKGRLKRLFLPKGRRGKTRKKRIKFLSTDSPGGETAVYTTETLTEEKKKKDEFNSSSEAFFTERGKLSFLSAGGKKGGGVSVLGRGREIEKNLLPGTSVDGVARNPLLERGKKVT